MKKRLTLTALLFCIGFFATKKARASHNMGVDLSYECLNQCTIRVHLRAYRDCTGITPSSPSSAFSITSPVAGCALPTLIGAWSSPAIQEVTPICPGWATHCTSANATINGVEEYYWWGDFNICNAPWLNTNCCPAQI